MPFDLGMVVRCICSSEDSSGNEIILFGSDDGYVYEMEKGTSFDGSAVTAFIRLAFNHIGSPAHNKRFHKATLELDANPNSELQLTAEFDYANPNQPAAPEQSFTVQGGGGFWDEAIWEDFYWDAAAEGTAQARIQGKGANVSLAIRSEETHIEPHVLHGLTLHHSMRGLKR